MKEGGIIGWSHLPKGHWIPSASVWICLCLLFQTVDFLVWGLTSSDSFLLRWAVGGLLLSLKKKIVVYIIFCISFYLIFLFLFFEFLAFVGVVVAGASCLILISEPESRLAASVWQLHITAWHCGTALSVTYSVGEIGRPHLPTLYDEEESYWEIHNLERWRKGGKEGGKGNSFLLLVFFCLVWFGFLFGFCLVLLSLMFASFCFVSFAASGR